MKFKHFTLLGCAAAALSCPSLVQAQGSASEPSGGNGDVDFQDDPIQAEEIIVTGRLFVRNRTSDPNPVLSYDLEYFQRFEPVSVGEMLKRLPGVTFASDVLEYDAVQLRGLPPGFTQVLINGRRAPGGEADRSFFVDRIPAELVERIEIVRAPRADQPSEGVAGTLNIVTKESAAFDGGFIKGGALINERDGEVRPSIAGAYADTIGETSFWGAVNYQGRRNPKQKVTDFFDGEFEELTGRELQEDTRDGEDISANGEISTRVGAGRLRLNGLVIDTNRDEDETSLVFEGPSEAELELEEVGIERERISQQTYALSADGSFPVMDGEVGLAAGWSGYRDDSRTEVDEGDTVAEAELVERETLDIEDDEYTGTLYYAFGPETLRIKIGADALHKQRDGANRVFEIEDGVEEEETPPGSIFSIEETRIDPYARVTAEIWDSLTLDAGLRYEITRRDVVSDGGGASFDDEMLNPSLHVRYSPTGRDTFRASLARTVRRPDYNLISPYRQEEEPADEDELIGNPSLANESAWGVDIGYERRVGENGILGANIFYRDISDVIELVDTGDVADAGGNVFQPRNIGSGETWGIELDLSTSLDFFSLPDTGIFANYTYLDSEVTDPFTGRQRRFSNQPHHIYNVGFIQNLQRPGVSFGASLGGRSDAFESLLGETVRLRYGQDLEAFVEKRFGERFVLRFTASNLLDRRKREDFRIFDGDSVGDVLDAQRSGEVAESERERESAGILFQATLRAAF